jgi:GNAT superfamily N-acetyltransferase
MNNLDFEFRTITNFDDYQIAKALFIEYANTLNFDLCFQDFEAELDQVAIQYNLPTGGLILLFSQANQAYVGCIGIRKVQKDVAELKRMYIKSAFRGQGLGRQLLMSSIKLARDLHYQKLRLDTVLSMKAAIHLYQSSGFISMMPSRQNPKQGTRYFELDLTNQNLSILK